MTDVTELSEEEQVEEQERRIKRAAELLEEGFRFILDDEKGRRVLWWLLSECGVFRISMTGNSATFFNEGRRDIGLRLMDRIMALRPDIYAEMYRESRIDPDAKT